MGNGTVLGTKTWGRVPIFGRPSYLVRFSASEFKNTVTDTNIIILTAFFHAATGK